MTELDRPTREDDAEFREKCRVEMEERKVRRVMVLRLDCDSVLALIARRHDYISFRAFHNDLPEDVEVHAIHTSFERQCFELLLWSKGFDVVPAGERVPEYGMPGMMITSARPPDDPTYKNLLAHRDQLRDFVQDVASGQVYEDPNDLIETAAALFASTAGATHESKMTMPCPDCGYSGDPIPMSIGGGNERCPTCQRIFEPKGPTHQDG